MVKDENDIIIDWILYHGYIFGYNNIYIIDNFSTDGTYELILKFNNLINIYRKDDYKKKGVYMTELINKYCTSDDIAFPVDIDEFIVYYDKNKKNIDIDKDIIINYIKNLPIYEIYKCAYLNPILTKPFGHINIIKELNYASYNNYGSNSKSFINKKVFNGIIDHGNHIPTDNFLLTNIVLIHYHHRNINQHKKKNINNLLGLGYIIDENYLKKIIVENPSCEGIHHIHMFLNYTQKSYILPHQKNPNQNDYINIIPLKNKLIYLYNVWIRENKLHYNFDWINYINNYEDLRNAGINTYESALEHYNTYGRNEGRIYEDINFNMINNNFDWETYINNYEDLRIADINTEEKAFEHFINFGKSECRTDKKII